MARTDGVRPIRLVPETTVVIRHQQSAVQDRFPGECRWLFPGFRSNRAGRHHISYQSLLGRHWPSDFTVEAFGNLLTCIASSRGRSWKIPRAADLQAVTRLGW